jgi:Zn-finger nucleic acid-binding protein
MSAMNCPRCRNPTERVDAPKPDGDSAWIERCASAKSCGSWYDPQALPALHAQFENHEVRDALTGAAALDVDRGTRVACPRCANETLLAPVSFAGVTLDVCPMCHGVWVDHAEYASLMSALRLHAPGVVPAIGAAYRSAPMRSAMQHTDEKVARCVKCKLEIPFADAIVTERGLMCVPCGSALA